MLLEVKYHFHAPIGALVGKYPIKRFDDPPPLSVKNLKIRENSENNRGRF